MLYKSKFHNHELPTETGDHPSMPTECFMGGSKILGEGLPGYVGESGGRESPVGKGAKRRWGGIISDDLLVSSIVNVQQETYRGIRLLLLF